MSMNNLQSTPERETAPTSTNARHEVMDKEQKIIQEMARWAIEQKFLIANEKGSQW